MSAREVNPPPKLSAWERLHIIVTLLIAPLSIARSLLAKAFTPYSKSKTWTRLISDSAVRALTKRLNARQMRVMFGTTLAMYEGLVKKHKLQRDVVELEDPDGSKLLWIGERKDKVVLYLHGGAFLFAGGSPEYWYFIQKELGKRGTDIGVAMLEYSFMPDKPFPTQLTQTVYALNYLTKTLGIPPSQIVIAGDSAGGALIHQLISHTLHPLPSVPAVDLSSPLGGTYLMSCWSTIIPKPTNSIVTLSAQFSDKDILSASCASAWGALVVPDATSSAAQGHLPYVEANSTPPGWFDGVQERVTSKVLMSAGGSEVLRDEIIKHHQLLSGAHGDAMLYVQKFGIHNDPCFDVTLGDTRVRDLTEKILDWIVSVYE